MTGEEGDRQALMSSYAGRVAWSAVGGDEEPGLFLLKFEGVAECRSSDDSDERGRHGQGARAGPPINSALGRLPAREEQNIGGNVDRNGGLLVAGMILWRSMSRGRSSTTGLAR